MNKLLLPILFCLLISVQTLFGQKTRCGTKPVDVALLLGWCSTYITPTADPGASCGATYLISNSTITYNGVTKSVSSCSFTPTDYFAFNEGLNTVIFSYYQIRYDWIPAPTSQWELTGSTQGPYTQSFIVEIPYTVNLQMPAIICQNATITLQSGTPAGGTYSESDIGFSASGTPSFSPSNASVGSHTMTYSITNITCSSTTSGTSNYTVVTPSNMNPTLANFKDTMCKGDNQTLQVNNNPVG